MLTGNRTRRVDIPDEEGQWVELRELSGRQLRKIKKVKFKDTIQDSREMGGELMAAIAGVKQEDLKASAKDALAEYDMDELLEAGIVVWSYVDDDGNPVAVNSDNIGQLDQKTEKFIAMQLVGAEEEEDQKKDS